MRISRVYIAQPLSVDCTISLDSTATHYLKNVLRLKAGATVDLFNGEADCDYRGQLVAEGKGFGVNLVEVISRPPLPSMISSIVQGISRPDHLDWMIQKTTELGVHHIHLFNSRYTQSPLKPAQQDKKMRHWQGIAISSSEQSGRTRIPSIHFHSQGIDCLHDMPGEKKVLLDFDAPKFDGQGNPPASLTILLGPEGGLESSEIECAKTAGFEAVSLGPRVLRTETAAVTAMAIAQSAWGNW